MFVKNFSLSPHPKEIARDNPWRWPTYMGAVIIIIIIWAFECTSLVRLVQCSLNGGGMVWVLNCCSLLTSPPSTFLLSARRAFAKAFLGMHSVGCDVVPTNALGADGVGEHWPCQRRRKEQAWNNTKQRLILVYQRQELSSPGKTRRVGGSQRNLTSLKLQDWIYQWLRSPNVEDPFNSPLPHTPLFRLCPPKGYCISVYTALSSLGHHYHLTQLKAADLDGVAHLVRVSWVSLCMRDDHKFVKLSVAWNYFFVARDFPPMAVITLNSLCHSGESRKI